MQALDNRKLRYLLGAGLCAAINNVILIGGDALGFGYVGLSVTCFLVTGTFAYAFHARFTFRQDLRWKSYLLYMFGIFFGLPVSVALMHVLYDMVGLPMWIAAPTLTVLMVVYNYAVTKLATTFNRGARR
ncbi:GtrA family protein [Paragemmobacter straminiformis]|uniref:GtrA family protein n=1 Tax=Paragemmobacter straminiformis TaxID=2045119 RepID=A0A842I5U4_9RHOB|nr:GtrA family protein [Gemmobacter straminiformis]MBC2835029.1 GtrA family protein [Gemmobacter straminiformis]